MDSNIPSRFDKIYDSTHKTALTYITAKCGRTADISDIFQETYMEAYQVLVRCGASYITNDNAFMLRVAPNYTSCTKKRYASIPLFCAIFSHIDSSLAIIPK